jgi:hypothetical protein
MRSNLRSVCQQVAKAADESEERLKAVLRRLPGWNEDSSTPALVVDFLASEYGWTLKDIAGLDNRQIIAFVNQALRMRASEQLPDNEEWLPASKAAERAEQSGHAITVKWLTKDAGKHGVKTRQRRLPGRHKKEVEWNSLAGHLLKQARPEEESEAINHRIREAQEQKRKDRSLD